MTNDQLPADDRDVWERLKERMASLTSGVRSAADPAALALRLANRAKMLRGRVATVEPVQAATQFLALNSGRERFGIPLTNVIEIQTLDHYSPVPKTPSFLVGVIHWRGAMMSLLDLSRLFDIPPSGLADYHVCVIVEAAGMRVAFLAREVEEILSIPLGQMKPVPELPGGAPSDWVTGIHDGNRLLLCPEKILQDEKLVKWRK